METHIRMVLNVLSRAAHNNGNVDGNGIQQPAEKRLFLALQAFSDSLCVLVCVCVCIVNETKVKAMKKTARNAKNRTYQ